MTWVANDKRGMSSTLIYTTKRHNHLIGQLPHSLNTHTHTCKFDKNTNRLIYLFNNFNVLIYMITIFKLKKKIIIEEALSKSSIYGYQMGFSLSFLKFFLIT